MNFFKKAADVIKPSLVEELHRKMAVWEKARSHKRVHASDLTKPEGFCPRQYALLDVTKKKRKDQFIGTSLQHTFQTGRSLQQDLNERWAEDMAVGIWKCLYCGKEHGFCKRPATCAKCGAPARCLQYEEENFFHPSGYSGSIDQLTDLGEPKLRVTEVKTMKADEFKTLLAPLAEHRLRTNLYLRTVAESDHPFKSRINTQEGLILYICKGFGFKADWVKDKGLKDSPFSPFKEFWVERDDEATAKYLGKAEVLRDYRTAGAGIPSGSCNNSFCGRAKSCPVRQDCWSGDHPAGG